MIISRNSIKEGTKFYYQCRDSSDDIFDSLCKLKIHESDQLKTVLELYDMEIHQKISMPNNQKLETMVKRSTGQKLGLRNFDARHGRIDVEGGKGTCCQGSCNTVYFAWKEMDSLDDSCSHTGFEPNACDLKETHVESYTKSLTHPHFSEQRFLEDVEYDDTALEDMLREAHRVHVYHSQREGLSVGQSSSVSERTVRPVESIGQELNVANAQD